MYLPMVVVIGDNGDNGDGGSSGGGGGGENSPSLLSALASALSFPSSSVGSNSTCMLPMSPAELFTGNNSQLEYPSNSVDQQHQLETKRQEESIVEELPTLMTEGEGTFMNRLLHGLRLLLHLGVIIALTVRSTEMGNALHPYQRSLANEWIHLLFYVEWIKLVPTWDAASPVPLATTMTAVPVLLPHFLMEIEEEIAANVDDEFFSGGFAARASSFPVGMLFTIEETKQHLHGAVGNYFRLAEVALDEYIVSGMNDSVILPPKLTVRSEVGDETIDKDYVITGKSDDEWPEPLQLNHVTNQTREFFDQLDALELVFVIGSKHKDMDDESSPTVPIDDQKVEKIYEWWVVITYDLQSQGHLEVAMNYGLLRTSEHDDRSEGDEKEDVPPIFFDTNATFDWYLLLLISSYQCVEFALKWTTVTKARRRSQALPRASERTWKTVFVNNFWLWFILVLNVVTITCFFEAWYHPYRLFLRDRLCLVFASCCALQWISLVRYLRVNTRFHILGLTLQRGLPRVAQFLVGVLPIFVGYVLFGTIMFGAKVPRFQSPSATATTLFSVANGDEIHDTFNSVSYTPWIGQIYVYSYMILFSYVVLMVCIGIIEDAFFSAVFPASWPSLDKSERRQAQQHQRHHEEDTIDERFSRV